jgi:hypothetical protein
MARGVRGCGRREWQGSTFGFDVHLRSFALSFLFRGPVASSDSGLYYIVIGRKLTILKNQARRDVGLAFF